jgi:hypothetical protein
MADGQNEVKKGSVVSVRLNPHEEKLLRAEATKRGVSVATVIKRAALSTVRPTAYPTTTSTTVVVGGVLTYMGAGHFAQTDQTVKVEPR